MPFAFQKNGRTVKVSFKDMFKTSRALKDDLDAIARRRAAIAEKNELIEAIMKAEKVEEEAEKKNEAEAEAAKAGQDQNQNQNQNNSSGSRGRTQPQTQTVPSGGIVYGTAHMYAQGQQKEKAQTQTQTQRLPGGGIVWGPSQTYNPGQQKQNGNSSNNNNNNNNSSSSSNGQGWTAEQDAELRRMKADNSSWKAIAIELGKHVHEVKTRWGQVRPKDEESNKGKDKGKQREREDKTEPKAIVVEEPKKETKPWKTNVPPDPDFTVAELVLLNQLAAKYEDDKWLRISSRFFDKTGKRLSPKEAKERVDYYQ